MRFSKIISKSLAIGLLFNSMSTSFASTLSEDGRYETFEGNNITIDNILEEDKVDIEIEGNTLVNLWKGFSHVNSNGWLEGKLQYEDIQGDITICNFSSKEILFQLSYNDGTNAENSCYSRSVSVMPGKKIKVNVLPNEKFRMIQGRYEHGWNNTEEDIEEFNSSLVVIKGDYLEEDIKYFEGMKSVGQDDVNGHKIKIYSQNNLADISTCGNTNFEIANLKAGKTYSIKLKRSDSTVPYNLVSMPSNKSLKRDIYTDFVTFKAIADEILFFNGHTNVDISEIILLEGIYTETTMPNFNSFNINKKEILLNEPLRALYNGAKDKIIKRNGQWVIERNFAEIILDGDENWKKANRGYNDSITTFWYETKYTDNSLKSKQMWLPKQSGRGVSDKFNWIGDELYYNTVVNEGFAQGHLESASTDKWYIAISNNKLSSIDVNGFKEWLKSNPIKIVYELANPIYEPLNIDSTVNTYLETTYISNNSIIPPNIKVTIDRVVNRAVEAIELAKVNPTITNLSLARMWSNLLKETIKKDELQNEINSITNIEDLQLEKKTSSANVDVYIKSENMLLMSLSTNSITFNDYSGVEDIELNNIVNISINSSLPYQLNSYLLSEIESADKSNRIEKDLLNIKISKDSDYKNFSDINEKLILEDDCDAGNNKSHSIDLKLKGSQAHKADVYKTVIKFEAEQK